jgi:restriction system protein
MLPLLQQIADGAAHTNRQVASSLAQQFKLDDKEITQLLPSGQQRVFTNRVAWAKAYLKRAGLLESPSRGTVQISELGRGVLAGPPADVDLKFLKKFPSYDRHRTTAASDHEPIDEPETGQTPEELLESSYEVLREQLAVELLEKLKTCSPAFFERLVVQLLVAMGYGGSLADAGQAVGRSGDGGIDGIIKEDKLGLDVVCIQAKRWPENTVGRPTVQAFAGSMEGVRAKKGVFITTSGFSREAEDYVSRTERKIVLIDGKQLAEFMIDHNVGVTTARTFVLKRLDLDYFLEEEN